jgi:hypothetical protein
MSQQIIEAQVSNSRYFKVPKGKNIEDAYEYSVKYDKLFIQWEKDNLDCEVIESFNETENSYKYPAVILNTKQEMIDDGMDWVFSSSDEDEDDEDDETICDADCDCVNCEDEREE